MTDIPSTKTADREYLWCSNERLQLAALEGQRGDDHYILYDSSLWRGISTAIVKSLSADGSGAARLEFTACLRAGAWIYNVLDSLQIHYIECGPPNAYDNWKARFALMDVALISMVKVGEGDYSYMHFVVESSRFYCESR